jgi:hypothetical protein
MQRPGQHFTTFAGGRLGVWRVDSIRAVTGESLPAVERVAVHDGLSSRVTDLWALRGVAGHVRYVDRREKDELDSRSPSLGRPESTCAALIPIRKSDTWWTLAQDERRAIFETRSRHIADSLEFLPRIARRLHHARELGEPFDFVTWFEFAPEHADAFDRLQALLRSREEWDYVEREVEIRLTR